MSTSIPTGIQAEDAVVRNQLMAELVKVRKDKKLRQYDVAQRLGVGQPAISELERGQSNLQVSTLQRYARAIGVQINFQIISDA